MSAELLREAAAKMRERAKAATPGPWVPNGTRVDQSMVKAVADCYDEPRASKADAEHIASWHPAVALAVADWLDNAAEDLEMQNPGGDLIKQWDMRVHIVGDKALTVARAYLGRDA